MDFGNNTENEERKLGIGIKAISILYFVGVLFIFASILYTYYYNKTTDTPIALNPVNTALTIIFGLMLLAGIRLIFKWKKLGVYLFFGSILLTLANNIIFSTGIKISDIFSSLLLPAIMLFFLRNKFKYFE